MEISLSPEISLLNAQMYVNISPFWFILLRLSLPITSSFTVVCSDLALKSTISIVKSLYCNLLTTDSYISIPYISPSLSFHNTEVID